jgi:hypothetical protein
MKTIKYFVKSQYGQDREFVHPENEKEGQAIAGLTGQKTLTPRIRELICSLAPEIKFEEVLAPRS